MLFKIEMYSLVSFGSFLVDLPDTYCDIELPYIIPASVTTGRQQKSNFHQLEVNI